MPVGKATSVVLALASGQQVCSQGLPACSCELLQILKQHGGGVSESSLFICVPQTPYP